ncbi:MAG: ABC transporter substrate-binding protein [Ahrensia sp.]|nr:ABC transporter substrate-binding protein [Ahrensia sp.]
MRFAIKLAAVAVAVSAMAGSAFSMDKVRIGTEGAYPPFNFKDASGELKGFDIDIANALCEEMKVECTFVAQDWDGIIPALLANKYDAIIASMSITEERKKTVDFSDKYYSTPPALIAPKDTDLIETTPAALEGKTIGTQSSTTHATFLEDKYTGSTIKLYPTQDEANADLAAGRLDAVAADSVVLGEYLKTEAGSGAKMVGMMENDPKYFGDGAGIAVRKGEDELREKFNAAIAAILANGKYKEINDKYFDFSVY